MNLCPHCKKARPSAAGPCPSCGRGAPAPGAGDGWDDGEDVFGGGLELSRRGSSAAGARSGPSAYSGGGLALGDDDPFADDVPQGSLELDVPAAHKASAPRAPSIAPPPRSGGASGGFAPTPGDVPAFVLEPTPSQRRPPGQPKPTYGEPDVSQPRPQRESQPPTAPEQWQAPGPEAPPPSPPMRAAPPAPRPPPPPDPAAMIARYPAPPAQLWAAPAYAMKVLYRQLELRQDLESLRKKRSPDVALYERALNAHDAKTFAVGLAISCAGVVIATFLFFLPVIIRFLRDPS